MFDRLEVFEKKYEECNQKLYDPAVVSDPEAYAALMKEVKGLEPVVEKYKEYKKQKNNEEEAKQLLAEGGLEKDFREMVELELEEARESLEKISEELKILLLPKDPNDGKNVIMELPYVLECGVSAAPDEVRGQVVKASIVLVKGTEGTEELKKEIQNYVKQHTAPYKYPRIVEFKEELPKTISGKIIRNQL